MTRFVALHPLLAGAADDETEGLWVLKPVVRPEVPARRAASLNPTGAFIARPAGGGVKGGVVHGATDDVGYKAVGAPHSYSDLHATILHRLGLDHAKMEVQALSRTLRLVEEEEGKGPIRAILG